MTALPRGAIVSFWASQYDMTPSQFVGSGVFVAERRVLTAKHLFDGGAELWLRPQASMGQSQRVEAARCSLHPGLDAALVEIDFMPPECNAAALDLSGSTPPDADGNFLLNGFFNGVYEEPSVTAWLAYEADDRQHRLATKQPRGHSGSGLSRAGRLWGVAVAHYTDPNVHRGCAVSLAQLWPDWLEHHAAAPAALQDALHRFDVGRQLDGILQAVGQGALDEARQIMLKLVDNFPTKDDRAQSALISCNLNEFEQIGKSRALRTSERKERNEWVGRMLTLANGIFARLAGELDGR